MAYVYQHRRLDTNEIFYVGIAKSKKRFYSHRNRNAHWKRIAKKCGYEVDVLIRGCTWEDACKIEKGLIESLGRKDLRAGSLANMTDGGEGGNGIILSKESKNKISMANKGEKNVMKNSSIAKKVSEKLKLKNVIAIDQYSLDKNLIQSFYSVQEAYRQTGIATSSISKCCKGKLKTAGKYIWKYKK